ncbi:hypothetical protein WG66_002600 [Moniliophthora roreri]|nr:hypothetical protein WG66_002600 [Moniliophthora roreri]
MVEWLELRVEVGESEWKVPWGNPDGPRPPAAAAALTEATTINQHRAMITLFDIGPVVIDGKETGFSPFTRRIMFAFIPTLFSNKINDIEPTAKSVNAPPTALKSDGVTPQYTVPFLTDSTTSKAISDSALIAEYLDSAYPSTTRISPQNTSAFANAIYAKFRALYALLGPKGKVTIMTPVLIEGMRKVHGSAVADPVVPTPEQEAAIWRSTRASFDEMYHDADLEDLGEPTYASFALAGTFWCFRSVFGRDSKEWKEVSTVWAGGRIGKVLEVIEGYESMQV